MTFETFVALLASIEKWEQNTRVKEVAEAKIFADDCPLCALFCKADDFGDTICFGCPVFERTSRHECAETPWKGAHVEYRQPLPSLPAFHRAAQREVEFLQSLLPPIWAS